MSRLRQLLGSRVAYLVLALVAGAALTLGSVHPAAPSRAARLGALEAEIKCPSCADLTIGQSDAAAAVDLRNEVTDLVDAGWSNAAIRARVVAQYGPSVLEVPDSGGVSVLVFLLPSLLVIALAAGVATVLVRRLRAQRALAVAAAQAEDEALVASARAEVG